MAACLCFVALFLAGCKQSERNYSVDNSKRDIGVDLGQKNNQKDCEEAGGLWEVAGMSGIEKCFNKYSDGGRQCNSYKDCQGGCIYDREQKTGVCRWSDYPYGCRSEFENGKILPELCTD